MRAYRKRAAEKRNVTTDSEALETIALLRKENTRLHRLLAEAQAQIPKPAPKKKAKRLKQECPICKKPVKLINDPAGLTVPRHRAQFRTRICKGSNILLSD